MGITHICDGSGNITARVKGNTYNVPPDHKFYDQIKAALKRGNSDRFVELADLGKGIASFISTNNEGDCLIKIVDGVVFYKNQSIHNTVTDRIIQFMEKGLPYEPLVKFLEKLLLNPSRHSVNQLYGFLENHNLPLTEDGCFLAYKRVNNNWRDYHTGTVDNSIGATPKMDRREVDDDFKNDCSYGLHVGAINYVRGFHSGDGHVVAVKVDPQNAVSVPEYDSTKMRVCEYLVMEEIADPDSTLRADLYKTEGVSYTPVAENQWDSDEDDEDEDEDSDEWSDESDEGFDDDNDDCEDEDEDEEDEDEEDEEDDDDPSFSVTSDDDDEEDNNFEMVKNWAETINIPVEYVESNKVKSLISDGNSEGVIQCLYALCIENNEATAVANLEKKIYRGRLKDILSDN